MSEYQFYEFRAIDKALSEREVEKLEDVSSRAEITPRSFINEYNYGDLRGDPVKLLEKYFDAFVYVANWGTRRLMFRFPKSLIDTSLFKPYCRGECLSLTQRRNYVILEFLFADEGEGGWEEGEGWMDALVDIRDEILSGDLRSLWLAWLLNVQLGYLEEKEPVPSVPAGLKKLTTAQKALMEFLRLEDPLVKATAKWSGSAIASGPTKKDYRAWIAKIPVSAKNQYLLQVMEGTDNSLRAELVNKFRKKTNPPTSPNPAPHRTVADLQALSGD